LAQRIGSRSRKRSDLENHWQYAGPAGRSQDGSRRRHDLDGSRGYPGREAGPKTAGLHGEILESINGGLGVSERWIQQRPDQIKRMITGVFRGMAYARTHRPESIALVMSKWKMERDVAEKTFDLMLKTWSDNGQASEQAVQTWH